MNKKIKCVEISYREWALFGTVWRYEDRIKLLDLLLNDNKVISGGDILVYDDGAKRLSYSGSNWYYEGDSCLESNIVAQKYLSRLENRASKESLYIALTIKNDPVP